MMWECSFIFCNQCPTQEGNVDNEGGHACVGQDIYGKSLYFLLNFFHESKMGLINIVYKLKVKKFCLNYISFHSDIPLPLAAQSRCSIRFSFMRYGTCLINASLFHCRENQSIKCAALQHIQIIIFFKTSCSVMMEIKPSYAVKEK